MNVHTHVLCLDHFSALAQFKDFCLHCVIDTGTTSRVILHLRCRLFPGRAGAAGKEKGGVKLDHQIFQSQADISDDVS